MLETRKWYDGMFSTEDWWSFWLGCFLVVLGVIATLTQFPFTGWIVKFSPWVDISKSFGSAKKDLMSPWGSLITSYIILTIMTAIPAAIMRWRVKDYIIAWTIIFILTVIAIIIGKHAYICAPATQWKEFGLKSGLQLGGFDYILALVIGLIIGNFFPKNFIEFMKTGARSEWFIKIGIMCLGVELGLKALESVRFATSLLLLGVCATLAAYFLYWPIAYWVLRRWFGYSREWASCFASAVSICGVSAAIATAGAVRARPIIPVLLSTLVVVSTTIQLILYPPLFAKFMLNEPIMAGAAVGLSVKTDGAQAAAGAILDELLHSTSQIKLGVIWPKGWVLLSAVINKMWIDMFVGLWAIVLAYIWVSYIEKKPGERIPKIEIWFRFPKFILGFFIAMAVVMFLGFGGIGDLKTVTAAYEPIATAFRDIFFLLTFTSIGIVTDFREFKKVGFGKLALAFGLVLYFIITPLAILIAWIFYHGMMPPTAGG